MKNEEFLMMNADVFFDSSIIKALKKGLVTGTILLSTFTLIYVLCFIFPRYEDRNVDIDDTINFMLDNYNKDDIILYIGFNDGGYAEYRGIKSYIDGRAELFSKKLNNKDDIFLEYKNLSEHGKTFDYESFINKYNFTHILLFYNDEEYFAEYLDNNSSYSLVYTDYFDIETDEPIESYRLYALKELDD